LSPRGLSKHFTHKGIVIKAVDEVSFIFTAHQFVTIIAPSGSGKSTLLYVLGGLDQATSGELQFDGVDVRRLSEQQEAGTAADRASYRAASNSEWRSRGLVNDPRVILADEPTGNQDSLNSKRIIELLKKLSEQGKTVIVFTHDRSIAKEADVRLKMADGRIRSTGKFIAPTRSTTPPPRKKGRKK
jgi:ABC-type lipoprotein export system ATPase subunit